jgi:hypothetical protein
MRRTSRHSGSRREMANSGCGRFLAELGVALRSGSWRSQYCCTALLAFGIFTIAVSSGVFVQLLGAIVMALGGSAGLPDTVSPESRRAS